MGFDRHEEASSVAGKFLEGSVFPIELSSYEFRTYRKQSGLISLRHRSYLLVHTRDGFNLTRSLGKFSGRLSSRGSGEVRLDFHSISHDVEFGFDGKTMIHCLQMWTFCAQHAIKPGLWRLTLEYAITLGGVTAAGVHQHEAVVRPLPWYRADFGHPLGE